MYCFVGFRSRFWLVVSVLGKCRDSKGGARFVSEKGYGNDRREY